MRKSFTRLFLAFVVLVIGSFTLRAIEQQSSSNSPPASPNIAEVNTIAPITGVSVSCEMMVMPETNHIYLTITEGSRIKKDFSMMVLQAGNYAKQLLASNNCVNSPIDARDAAAALMRDDRSHILKHPLFANANNSQAKNFAGEITG